MDGANGASGGIWRRFELGVPANGFVGRTGDRLSTGNTFRRVGMGKNPIEDLAEVVRLFRRGRIVWKAECRPRQLFIADRAIRQFF